MYHQHSRALQDRFDTRRLADRLAERLSRTEISYEDRAFIESRAMFFLATADAGGRPGFERVVDLCTLAFPSYDGNGKMRSVPI